MVYMSISYSLAYSRVSLVTNVCSLSSTAPSISLPGLCQREGLESSMSALRYARRLGLLDTSDIPMSSGGSPPT